MATFVQKSTGTSSVTLSGITAGDCLLGTAINYFVGAGSAPNLMSVAGNSIATSNLFSVLRPSPRTIAYGLQFYILNATAGNETITYSNGNPIYISLVEFSGVSYLGSSGQGSIATVPTNNAVFLSYLSYNNTTEPAFPTGPNFTSVGNGTLSPFSYWDVYGIVGSGFQSGGGSSWYYTSVGPLAGIVWGGGLIGLGLGI